MKKKKYIFIDSTTAKLTINSRNYSKQFTKTT